MPDHTAIRDTGTDRQATVNDAAVHLSTSAIDHLGSLLNNSGRSDKATNHGQNVLPGLELHDDGAGDNKSGEIQFNRPGIKHVLNPNDGGRINDIVKEQTADLALSPKGQAALQGALDAVANSNKSGNIENLGGMLPELFTADGGKARTAFEKSLTELGYTVNSSAEGSGRDAFGAKHFAMSITEPKNGMEGGGKIKVDYRVAAGLEAEAEINADKTVVKGF